MVGSATIAVAYHDSLDIKIIQISTLSNDNIDNPESIGKRGPEVDKKLRFQMVVTLPMGWLKGLVVLRPM